MRTLLSSTERSFLEDLISGKVQKEMDDFLSGKIKESQFTYGYRFQRMLRKRILDKEARMHDDLGLIIKARDKLNHLPSKRRTDTKSKS